MGRIGGEYSPPRELVAMGAARMAGRGSVEVSGAGLVFEGAILGSGRPVPVWASIAVLVVGTAISTFVPAIQQVLMPVTILVVCGIVALRVRAEAGRSGAYRVPWSEVEHVVRLASAPDVLAFVLARPIDGDRTPESVFFTATAGLDRLVTELRADAPPELTIDVESAMLPTTEVPEE